MAITPRITVHIADLDEVRNLLGQLQLERDAAQRECAEVREQIAADIEALSPFPFDDAQWWLEKAVHVARGDV